MSTIIWRHNVTWLAVLFLAMLATAVLGQRIDPPARFDHPFKGKVIVKYMDACRGCSGWTHGNVHGVCELYVVKTGYWFMQRVIRHEIAHCNGWPANHPD